MADLFVKIDELADYAASFAKLAGDSESASKSLVQGFAAFDNAWGSDAPGAAFFGAYTDPAADTLGCAQQVPVQLTALSTAMTDTARTPILPPTRWEAPSRCPYSSLLSARP